MYNWDLFSPPCFFLVRPIYKDIYSNYFIESIFFDINQSAKLEFYQRIYASLFPLLAKVQYWYIIVYRILCDSILNSKLLTRTRSTKGDGNTKKLKDLPNWIILIRSRHNNPWSFDNHIILKFDMGILDLDHMRSDMLKS
jgi:hypothetical protein